jgi:hypothetical protein
MGIGVGEHWGTPTLYVGLPHPDRQHVLISSGDCVHTPMSICSHDVYFQSSFRSVTICHLEINFSLNLCRGGHAVMYFVEALCYKKEDRGFETRWDGPNPSRCTMALGPTQPLTEMSTRNIHGVKGGRRIRLTILPPLVSRLSRENVGASTSHNPMGLHGLLQG